MQYKYKYAVLGGTFDRFHKGHREFLSAAFLLSAKVDIGIAMPALYSKKPHAYIVENYQARLASVKNYLIQNNLLNRAAIIPIDNIFGNTLVQKDIEAIFVTEDTIKSAETINSKRKELNLPPVAIEKIGRVLADDLKPVSSERIRSGEIDRDGVSYYNRFFEKKRFSLPTQLRDEFKKPLGKIIKNTKSINKFLDKKNLLFAVGDIVVINLFKQKILADIGIIDYRTRRISVSDEDRELLQLISGSYNLLNTQNLAGNIERRAIGVLRKAFEALLQEKRKQLIVVEGEEDLLAIPVIAFAPLESVVLYGQPDKGIVIVKVTEKKKEQVMHLLTKLH